MANKYKTKDLSWEVNLEVFEGPLDLLLHLIHQLEIDIYDIPIAQITDQFLKYIHSNDIKQLEDGGRYLVMAATLMSIKSELLVPRNESFKAEDNQWVEEAQDPRKPLTELLVEYQKFKKISQQLATREKNRQVNLSKAMSDLTEYEDFIPLQENDLSLKDLVATMENIYKEQEFRNPGVKWVERKKISVGERIEQILSYLHLNNSSHFYQLVDGKSKLNLVTTFLAVLELVKTNTIRVFQEDLNQEIQVTLVEKRPEKYE